MTLVLLLAVLVLAFANGANDTFKGVATLYGSETTSYRRALAYAVVATGLGAVVAAAWGGELVTSFGGKGLVPDGVVGSPAFATSVGVGAAATVLLATWLGLPVSTTHALTGALVGAGWMAVGADVRLTRLGSAFVLPLLVSPLAALVLAALVYVVLRAARRRLGIVEETCVCVGPTPTLVPLPAAVQLSPGARVLQVSPAVAAALPVEVSVGDTLTCRRRYDGQVLGVSAQRLLGALHVVSAFTVCFARALNDTPKLIGLLAVGGALSATHGMLAAGVVMAVGGLVGSRRVAETMSRRMVDMNAGQGFAANAVTASLVLSASAISLPVSTTHVSCGAICGIGAVNRRARLAVLAQVLLAWVTTLPLGAALAAGTLRVLTWR